MKKIGFIAPYFKLAEDVRKIGRLIGEDINVRIADGFEAVQVAKKMVVEGAEVIISRGGTAIILRDHMEIPIVEITVQAIDVMKAIHAAMLRTKKIGVCGYENVLSDLGSISELYKISLVHVVTSKEETIEEKNRKIYEISNVVEHIVGDALACQLAANNNLESTLIESGKDSILAAINESRKIIEAIKLDTKRVEELRTLLDCSREGIIKLSTNLNVLYINEIGESILAIKDSDAKVEIIEKFFPEVKTIRFTGESVIDGITRTKEKSLMYNIMPVKVDEKVMSIVIVFQDVGSIQNQEEKIRERIYLKGHVADYTFADIITNNKTMQQRIYTARKYSQYDANVLIMGETGSGKELFAQSIHNESKRAHKPFVAVNCGALPDNLLESELFGYVSGAFTGANKQGKKGMFEMAKGGTLFLDEVSEIGLPLQVKLLRVIQERKIMKLGDDRILPIDVRIIAATNRDLEQMVEERLFREDLYYRLNVLSLTIPPLRERKDDIPIYIDYFISKYKSMHGLPAKTMSPEAEAALQRREYKGNVRELENIVESLVIVVEDSVIDLEHINMYIDTKYDAKRDKKKGAETADIYDRENMMLVNIDQTMKEIENDIIMKLLEKTDGDKNLVAKKLGLGRTTIWRKVSDSET